MLLRSLDDRAVELVGSDGAIFLSLSSLTPRVVRGSLFTQNCSDQQAVTPRVVIRSLLSEKQFSQPAVMWPGLVIDGPQDTQRSRFRRAATKWRIPRTTTRWRLLHHQPESLKHAKRAFRYYCCRSLPNHRARHQQPLRCGNCEKSESNR